MNHEELNQTTHIPEWAVRASSGELELGAQLPTRDGRKVGNAHIVRISPASRGRTGWVFGVLTDAGSEFSLSAGEIEELFYPPMWVSDVAEVKRKFGPRD